ncbi:hypothetical protein HOC_17199 [Hyphomonas oceanitis SCH89]|uniref:Uncharacterized protein n=1 Tax=Hyphomonas oceanitis SCH89 TaxID=1280953 RepID=A0A059G3E4_9PROT|nr:hypothetical protein HOC_17199 [Hyphomonas oceanitis SCH89]
MENAANPSLRADVSTAANSAITQTRKGLPDAALSPLEDLNLRREEIPQVLDGVESPYQLSPTMTCEDVEARLAKLDRVLGPDWDTPSPDDRLKTEILADSAAEATLNALASEARGFIPFRGLIRKATGAESHEKKYNRAFKIGAQQRAYLKGYGLAKGCPPPARPDFMVQAVPDNSIQFRGDTPQLQPLPAPKPQAQPSETTLSRPTAPPIQSEGLQTVPPEY